MLQFDDDIDNINDESENEMGDTGLSNEENPAMIPSDIPEMEVPIREEDESIIDKEIQKRSNISFGGTGCDDCSGSCSAVCASNCASTCTSSYSN